MELSGYLFGLLGIRTRTPQELGLHPVHSWEMSATHQNVTERDSVGPCRVVYKQAEDHIAM